MALYPATPKERAPGHGLGWDVMLAGLWARGVLLAEGALGSQLDCWGKQWGRQGCAKEPSSHLTLTQGSRAGLAMLNTTAAVLCIGDTVASH